MKYKKAKKTSSYTDSLVMDYTDVITFGNTISYDMASVWKLWDSNPDFLTFAEAWRITCGGGPLKTSCKSVL